MKGIDIFCASQAATSIRLPMEESGGSSSSSSTATTIYLGGNTSGRALDRYNPIIRDATRITSVLLNTTARPPCSSSSQQPPITPPKPHHHKKKSGKNHPSKENNRNNHQHQNKKIISSKQNDDDGSSNSIKKKSFSSSWSCTKPGEFVSPPGSSRYLLTTTTHKSSFLSDDHFDPPLSMVPAAPHSTAPDQAVDHDNIAVVDGDSSSSANTSKLPNPSSSYADQQQAVVLRVSLHCNGCERKLKKHLSKMEGVRSFKIDFAAKKLTVVGDVKPLSVLASVSKVKNAQLLTPPLASSVCSNIYFGK